MQDGDFKINQTRLKYLIFESNWETVRSVQDVIKGWGTGIQQNMFEDSEQRKVKPHHLCTPLSSRAAQEASFMCIWEAEVTLLISWLGLPFEIELWCQKYFPILLKHLSLAFYYLCAFMFCGGQEIKPKLPEEKGNLAYLAASTQQEMIPVPILNLVFQEEGGREKEGERTRQTPLLLVLVPFMLAH